MSAPGTEARWRDLEPDPGLLSALDAAGARPGEGSDEKRKWGKVFADACSVMFANALRQDSAFSALEIRPFADGSGTESLTGVGGGGSKKVDVIASTLASGLQVALSLKAENFPHGTEGFGKNLLNRIYELQDEVRAIHEYQPRAYVVGVFFMPLSAAIDRPNRSSFARSVGVLRARTGRIDFTLAHQFGRMDWTVIGLYVPEDIVGGARRGVVRYFDVAAAPPKRGRPRIETTLDLKSVVSRIADEYRRDTGEILAYCDPEPD